MHGELLGVAVGGRQETPKTVPTSGTVGSSADRQDAGTYVAHRGPSSVNVDATDHVL